MRVEHTISIDAPPEVVWSVTTDVERWPEWTPTVTSVRRVDSEPFGLGSITRLKQPAQPEAEWQVIVFEPNRSFSWESRRPGLRFVGTHVISEQGAGTTNLLRMEADGFLALLLWPILRFATRRAIAAENAGLKRKAEQVRRLRGQ